MLNLDNKLLKDIEKYCILNKIEDINKEINNILQIGFNIVRFGTNPFEKKQMEKELTLVQTVQESNTETASSKDEITLITNKDKKEVKQTRKTRKIKIIKDE